MRTFTRADIPAVVELRRGLFRHTAQPGVEDSARFFARAFFDNPWQELDLPSYVHLDSTGEVNGFVGVIPRRMRFAGRTLRVSVPTQLMARPGTTAGAGLRLTRAIMDGPQDLTISDAANDAARRLWTRIGGATSLTHSLYWTLPLRRSRYALARRARTPFQRALARLARPVCAILDRPAGEVAAPPPPPSEPFDPVAEIALMNEVMATWPLHPEYDTPGLAWILEEVRRKRDCGVLQSRLVRDPRGQELGWFLYFANRGGVGEVVQLAARPGDQGRILASLVAHARAAGVVALTGRMEPQAMTALSALGAEYHRGGPWFLTYARDPRLLLDVLQGNGFLSRLEAEWWPNF